MIVANNQLANELKECSTELYKLQVVLSELEKQKKEQSVELKESVLGKELNNTRRKIREAKLLISQKSVETKLIQKLIKKFENCGQQQSSVRDTVIDLNFETTPEVKRKVAK